MTGDFWHLHGFDWLSELSAAEASALRRSALQRSYEPGEMIFTPNPTPHSVYLLEDGRVRVFRLSVDGSETTFGYVAPGEVFGELAVFADAPRESFAQAVEPCIAWRVPRAAFQRLIEERPSLVLEVTQQIGHRMKRIESRVENLIFRDAQSRLARILLELADDFGVEREGVLQLELDLTQAEIGTLIGSSRQTVNACLRDLEAAGMVEREPGALVIAKPEELRRLSSG